MAAPGLAWGVSEIPAVRGPFSSPYIRAKSVTVTRAAFAAIFLLGAQSASATVVKDNLCALFRADGSLQSGAFGVSTLAPSGVLHLVCRARLPGPGAPMIIDSTSFGPSPVGCNIEGETTFTWRERISAAGDAVLECWRRSE